MLRSAPEERVSKHAAALSFETPRCRAAPQDEGGVCCPLPASFDLRKRKAIVATNAVASALAPKTIRVSAALAAVVPAIVDVDRRKATLLEIVMNAPPAWLVSVRAACLGQ
jgi:hypothetical protein